MASSTDAEAAASLFSRCRILSDRTAQHLKRSAAETDDIGAEVHLLLKSVAELSKASKGSSDGEEAKELLQKAERILCGEGAGGDLRKLLPVRNHPGLLSLLLGKYTMPIIMRREQSFKVKEEYYHFRNHVGLVLVCVPAVLLLFLHRARVMEMEANRASYTLTPAIMCAVHMFLAWMLYAYTALALRENVLKMNGSYIRRWWIQHHYWSIITTVLLLTLPVDSRAVNAFLGKLLFWLSCQGGVMLLQNRYQRRRLYTRIALGKSNAMDVVGGESAGGQGQLYILYPFLFGLQFLQISLGTEILVANYGSILDVTGYLEMEPHETDLRGSRGVFYCGAAFFMMGCCNFYHTVLTIIRKRQVAREKTEKRKA
mmetsp:Transcript_16118/g.40956  ORF Transcript_16118/g.40956 Transcript_16118/m.40956 type:complete len:371 (-) Transcript_16118:92-1204(-)